VKYEYGGPDEEINKGLDKLVNYDTVESLYLYQSCMSGNIPSHVKQFKNLKSLKINGARMWDLTLENVPSTITRLEIDMAVNCPYVPDLLYNAPHLDKLEHLVFFFDGTPSNHFKSHSSFPLPDLASLKIIDLCLNKDGDNGYCYEWDGDWQQKMMKCDTFKLVASRVLSMKQINHDRLQITLRGSLNHEFMIPVRGIDNLDTSGNKVWTYNYVMSHKNDMETYLPSAMEEPQKI